MKVIHKDCAKECSRDKSLPRDSYLVTYIDKDKLKYDIVQASSVVEIFDVYYDDLGKGGIQKIQWTDGTIHSTMYGGKPKKKSK